MSRWPPGSFTPRMAPFCRPHHRRPPGDLAASKQALSGLGCASNTNGWRIAEDPPVRFRRSPGMRNRFRWRDWKTAFEGWVERGRTGRIPGPLDARPVILNGIEDIITPDLADRAILLMLAPIAERQRRPDCALWQEFELARPHILGALLDAAVHGLQMLPPVRLQRLPRMADFALWATACEGAFRTAGAFETAYWDNRHAAIENIVDTDPGRPVC